MRLLLDLGNTRLKWAITDAHGRMNAMQALVASDAPACWHALLDDLSTHAISHIALSSVAGARTQMLMRVLHQHLPDAAILQARSQAHCAGVTSGYLAPETLGVDRFLALLGAHGQAANTQVIAMLGTALTIDVLHASGQHLGGLIAPGPSLMQTSLHQSTAHLPLADGQKNALGRCTADAISAGCYRACAALIESVLSDFPGATLLLSGGAAAPVAALIKQPARILPELVLIGLQKYAHTVELTA